MFWPEYLKIIKRTMATEKVWSVGEVNRYVHNMMDDDYLLQDISIKGELSNVKYHSSGHVYFTLKDESSCISACLFASDRANLTFRLEAGDEVIIRGRVSVYEKAGSYQVYVKEVKRAGIGELYKRFEHLKQELLEMGMFDPMYKKPIPAYIEKLGVVTASTGAAVRDIINVSKRRNPYIHIFLYPAKVQGEGAADSIADGIRTLDRMGVDTIIIGRGGGSIEDLWAFNEEKVARAVFDCNTPVISGTGHETDVTIADLVADLRAPTPSAAAELAVFDYRAFTEALSGYRDSMLRLIGNRILKYREQAAELKARIESRSPSAKLGIRKEKLKGYRMKLIKEMDRILSEKKRKRAVFAETLSALSPLNTLSRGYTFTENERGKAVTSVKDVDPGEEIRVYTKDGRIYANVGRIEENRDR